MLSKMGSCFDSDMDSCKCRLESPFIQMCLSDDIIAAYERWSFKEPLPKDAQKKFCEL
ncbi:hypothetical protein QJS10_CPB04g01605 [Acorus calamus]|uniref:Uncharacterized protein n=1 Tax=Acorus calamus TaxID=4465 RepID=A0AAV9EXJ7_ACOCL|nr:hypothetical protein QJS10_CPB04g01605 [Acorus calamus]